MSLHRRPQRLVSHAEPISVESSDDEAPRESTFTARSGSTSRDNPLVRDDYGKRVKPLAAPLIVTQDVVPIPPRPEINDFKSQLLEYGRGCIRSAMDHASEDSQSLKDNIIKARQRIMTDHENLESEVKLMRTSTENLRERNRIQELAKLELEKKLRREKAISQDLHDQLNIQSEALKQHIERLKNESIQKKALEVEVADLQQDKKRKRESVAEIWEQAEMVKL